MEVYAMQRLFINHIVHKVNSLNGAWKFRTDPENCGTEKNWFSGLKDAELVTVPAVWNTQLDLLKYGGAAWYKKEFYTQGGRPRFCFGAVMTKADVWLDGNAVYIAPAASTSSATDIPLKVIAILWAMILKLESWLPCSSPER